MKRTWTIRGGELLDGQTVVGQLVSLELDIALPLGTPFSVGPPTGVRPTATSTSTARKQAKKSRHEGIEEVWAHYVAALDAARQSLNPTRERLIDNALKVRDIEIVKQAITGLARSPFHNGENEQRKKYTDIRYALKGNSQRGESNEERIDAMANLASSPAAVQRGQHAEHWIEESKRVIRNLARPRKWPAAQAWPEPSPSQIEDRGRAERRLEGYGINVRYEADGWPIFEEATA